LPFSSGFTDLKGNAGTPSSTAGATTSGSKLVCSGASGVGLLYARSGVPKLFEGTSFGTGNFTIEGWFQTSSTVAQGALIEVTDSSFTTGNWGLQINGNGVSNSGIVAFWARDVSASVAVVSSPASPKYNDGARHHVRVVRNGNQFTLYMDGVNVARFSSTVAFTDDSSTVLSFGVSGFTTRACAVTLDNWRILKGIAASTGSSFTVPTPPFPS
jgi:hypothetical protein